MLRPSEKACANLLRVTVTGITASRDVLQNRPCLRVQTGNEN